MKNNNLYKYLLVSLGLALALFVVSINTLIPSRDSGAFLYSGQQILKGAIPYKDLWDHKPPLIYYINSLAILITPNNLWGLWGIEIFSLAAVFFLIIATAMPTFGTVATITSLIVSFVVFTRTLNGGNRVEEFGVLFQAISLYAVFKYFDTSNSRKKVMYGLSLGFVSGLMFLLKPNLIGTLISFTVFIFFFTKKIREHFGQLFYVYSSFLLIFALTTLYLFAHGALPYAIDQVLVFNTAYSKVSLESTWSILKFLFNFLRPFSYFVFFVPAVLYYSKNKKVFPKLIFLTILLLVEIALSLVSKRTYGQYFLTITIPLALLVAVVVKRGIHLFENKFSKRNILLFLLFLFAISNFWELVSIAKSFDEHKPFTRNLSFRSYVYNNFGEHKETLSVIKESTTPSEKILIWGSEPSLLYLSDRESVDRYYYQFRLFLPGYDSNENRLTELIDNTIHKNPKIIIDASSSTADSLISDFQQSPPLSIKSYNKWLKQSGYPESPNIIRLIQHIETYYNKGIESYGGKWQIYIRK